MDEEDRSHEEVGQGVIREEGALGKPVHGNLDEEAPEAPKEERQDDQDDDERSGPAPSRGLGVPKEQRGSEEEGDARCLDAGHALSKDEQSENDCDGWISRCDGAYAGYRSARNGLVVQHVAQHADKAGRHPEDCPIRIR